MKTLAFPQNGARQRDTAERSRKSRGKKKNYPRICGRIKWPDKTLLNKKTEVTLHAVFYHKHLSDEMRNSPVCGKITASLSRPEQKFFADIQYGLPASKSCLLSEIAHALQEKSRKINVVDRLSQHLSKGTPQAAMNAYLRLVRRMLPSEPTVYIDNSDVIKPEGYRFEALGFVRDGSASTKDKTVYKKGYHVTEACAMTSSRQPVSIFSELHSSKEKEFTSNINFTINSY